MSGGKRRDWRPRYWKYVTFEPNTGCWLWTGAATANGYGTLGVGSRLMRATHLSVLLRDGAFPSTGLVMHRCDQPSCVNPEHLVVGTHKANVADMIGKGRHNAFAQGLLTR